MALIDGDSQLQVQVPCMLMATMEAIVVTNSTCLLSCSHVDLSANFIIDLHRTPDNPRVTALTALYVGVAEAIDGPLIGRGVR